MTTAFQQPLSRTLFVAALAIAGTIASFGATTTTAQAAAGYTARLAAPLEAPRSDVLGSALWKCAGDACSAAREDSSPTASCARVARNFGRVAAFTSPRGELSAEQLERCNARA